MPISWFTVPRIELATFCCLILSFSQSLAYSDACSVLPFEKEGKLGLLDEQGQVMLAPQFEAVIPEPCNLTAVAVQDDWAIVGRIVKAGNMKWGYIDDSGQQAIDYIFSAAGRFSEGLAPAKELKSSVGLQITGDWGYIGRNGSWIIPPRFSAALPFSEGLAGVRDGSTGRYSFINMGNKVVIPGPFENVGSFGNGLAPVVISNSKRDSSRWQYIDKNGKPVISGDFADAKSFSEGLAAVELASGIRSWGYIDTNGEVAIEPRFLAASSFVGDYAVVISLSRDSCPYRFIDRQGDFVSSESYCFAWLSTRGNAIVRTCDSGECENGTWQYRRGPVSEAFMQFPSEMEMSLQYYQQRGFVFVPGLESSWFTVE